MANLGDSVVFHFVPSAVCALGCPDSGPCDCIATSFVARPAIVVEIYDDPDVLDLDVTFDLSDIIALGLFQVVDGEPVPIDPSAIQRQTSVMRGTGSFTTLEESGTWTAA